MSTPAAVLPRLHRFCDDASAFAPLSLPLAEALDRHLALSRSTERALLGPLLVAPEHVDDLVALIADAPPRSLWLALTATDPAHLTDAITAVTARPAVRFAGAEIVLPDDCAAADVVPRITAAVARTDVAELEMYVEVPHDDRRLDVLDALADSDFDAKLRIAGPRARPALTSHDVAVGILDAVRRHLPFKATGDLGHAVTPADGNTGSIGFLNLFLATDAARQAVDIDDSHVLAEHLTWLLDRTDADDVAHRVRDLDAARALAARSSFTSFGCPDVTHAVADLTALGLVRPGN